MTVERKIMTVAGVLLLIMIHLTIAFALGVYLGRYGFSREGLALQGPNRPAQDALAPPRGGSPARQPASRLPGEPTLVGRVQRIKDGYLSLLTQDGPRQTLVRDSTQIWDINGEIVSLGTLAEGHIVAVFGNFDDGGRQLRANLIVILPPPE